MAFESMHAMLADHPRIRECLEKHGFQRATSSEFSNGRAQVRFERDRMVAEPGDGSRAWISNLTRVPPEAVVETLNVVLAAQPFLSQQELDRRFERTHTAKIALDRIVEVIREAPDTHSGRELRRFLWSLFNPHHVVNLWSLKCVLDSRANAWVTEVFTAWMDGCISEEALRRALTDSGEMDRWDAVRLPSTDHRRLTDAIDAVNELLTKTAPGAQVSQLSHANAQLREALESLKRADSSEP